MSVYPECHNLININGEYFVGGCLQATNLKDYVVPADSYRLQAASYNVFLN